MVFGPFGIRVGAEFFNWADIETPPSLGLMCAISGAAVGAGMGRRTSLGMAMALTLANVRLGYWFKAVRRKDDKAPLPRVPFLSGLICLRDELLGRFGTGHHWFLSDGGHSENSGALSLLERGCSLILVADNGEDASFTFCDLEIFIRTARTDIGMEVTVVSPTEFPKGFALDKACFFNGATGNWRARVKNQDDSAFALLLKATDIAHRAGDSWELRSSATSWIIWLKPNRLADLPADIATYAETNPDFPQQSTNNQFFDEAQWESYRRLGFKMGRRLFQSPLVLSKYLPIIYKDISKDIQRPSFKLENSMFDQHVTNCMKSALRLHEIGEGTPYEISFAGKGKSGASFGFMQGDLATGQKQAIAAFQACLLNADFPAAEISNLDSLLSKHYESNPLSEEQTNRINNALKKSSKIVDHMDNTIFADVQSEVESCAEAAKMDGKSITTEALIYITLWVNMTGKPTSLIKWLSGEDPRLPIAIDKAPDSVDGSAMLEYLSATKYYTNHPKNLQHAKYCVQKAIKKSELVE